MSPRPQRRRLEVAKMGQVTVVCLKDRKILFEVQVVLG
jgi:hypothetical protein